MDISYSAEQQAAIDAALAAAQSNEHCDYEWSDAIAQRPGQTFAVFGRRARQLLDVSEIDTDDHRFEYVPMIVDGRILEQRPHEGDWGVAYLMRAPRLHGRKQENPRWWVAYIPLAWAVGSDIG